MPAFAALLTQHIPIEAGKLGFSLPTTIDEFVEDLFFNNAFSVFETQFPSILPLSNDAI
jgi:hypothetical protein